jgi:hypothetical protein
VSDHPAFFPSRASRARLHVTRVHTPRDGRTGRAPSVPDGTPLRAPSARAAILRRVVRKGGDAPRRAMPVDSRNRKR